MFEYYFSVRLNISYSVQFFLIFACNIIFELNNYLVYMQLMSYSIVHSETLKLGDFYG